MRAVATLAIVSMLALVAVGCQEKAKPVEPAGNPPAMTADDMPPTETPPGPTATSDIGPVPAAPAGNGHTYTVKKGEGLMAIARTQLGNASRWKEIAALNNIQPPYALKVGQALQMPAK